MKQLEKSSYPNKKTKPWKYDNHENLSVFAFGAANLVDLGSTHPCKFVPQARRFQCSVPFSV